MFDSEAAKIGRRELIGLATLAVATPAWSAGRVITIGSDFEHTFEGPFGLPSSEEYGKVRIADSWMEMGFGVLEHLRYKRRGDGEERVSIGMTFLHEVSPNQRADVELTLFDNHRSAIMSMSRTVRDFRVQLIGLPPDQAQRRGPQTRAAWGLSPGLMAGTGSIDLHIHSYFI